MIRPLLVGVLLLTSTPVFAGGPEYDDDPFADADFKETPLILDVAHPTRGRAEVAAFFSSSFLDKYTSHTGGMLELSYHFHDAIGIGLSFGYLHGQVTTILNDPNGVIGLKVDQCRIESGNRCGEIKVDLPDLDQVTGVASATAIVSPLYGKINVFSELDLNLQLYLLAGGGVNGTRQIRVLTDGTPQNAADYQVVGQGFGDAGLFDNARGHVVAGVGLKVFVANWLALRAEVRDLIFWDDFDLNGDGAKESYATQRLLAHVGVGFALF